MYAHVQQFLFIKRLWRMIRNYKSFVHVICLDIFFTPKIRSVEGGESQINQTKTSALQLEI